MRVKTKTRNPHNGGQQLPLVVPASDWIAPTVLPDLRQCRHIALDTEGKDESLKRGRGSGWPYRAGYIAGVSIAWEGGALYAPIRHPDTECIDYHQMGQWIRDHIAAGCRFITHHGSHDWGWIWAQWGIEPPTNIDDTEAMAMIVDENRLSYSLANLCTWRGVPGKDEDKLREAAAAYALDAKSDLWQLPARYVGPYAEQDARALLPLTSSLMQDIREEGTEAGYQLEMDIMPTVLRMRMRGIRVDLESAQELKNSLLQQRDAVLQELGEKLERRVSIDDCRSARVLERWFDEQKIKYPTTEKTGQGSFQAQWMRKHSHWLPRLVTRAEQLTEAADKFVQGFILDYAYRGRLHAHINQYRGEEGGTRSFRFSYADPPLQQMPARDAELAPLIRGLFLPEDGEIWAACDYSQQEYRLIVHYAAQLECTKAEEAVQQYCDNPNTDFHALVAEWTGLDRKPAKDTNFAKAFGAGVPKFAQMINKSREEAEAIYQQYDRELPFVSEAAKECQRLADRRGYIKLIDGTRSHFNHWEPTWREKGEQYSPPGPLEYAREKWPERRLRRAFTHKAFNRLIQGSAARMTKAAIKEIAKEGWLPLIQMHDELGFSINSAHDAELIRYLMATAVPLCLPIKVDVECGDAWGTAKNEPSWIDDRRRTAKTVSTALAADSLAGN